MMLMCRKMLRKLDTRWRAILLTTSSDVICGGFVDRFSAAIKPCWNENSKQRPAFSVIAQHVQEFRSGAQRAQSGYYATDEVRGQELYTNQEMYADAH